MARIHEDAPPFLLIHGEQDTIIPVDEARQFHASLAAVSRNPVELLEIPRAGHAFDLVDASHARRSAAEISRFLTEVVDRHRQRRPAAAV
jgi:acetyl esterase/lipase